MTVQIQNPTAAPTEKQISYAVSLYRSLYDPAGVDENIEEAVLALCEGLYDGTRAEASAAIDSLKALHAVKQAEKITEQAAQPAAAPAPAAAMSAGMYRTPAGDIVKVQANRQNGNLYGKTLTKIGGERLTENGLDVHFDFVYSGSIRNLTPAMRMTLDEAIAFGIRYGVCCNCGASLKDATSVAAGIGPKCAKRFA